MLTGLQTDLFGIVFQSFYAAVSLDVLARGMNKHSTSLHSTLNDAEKYYQTAQQAVEASKTTVSAETLSHQISSDESDASTNRQSVQSFGSTTSQFSDLSSPASSTWFQDDAEKATKLTTSHEEQQVNEASQEQATLPRHNNPPTFDDHLALLMGGSEDARQMRDARLRKRCDAIVLDFEARICDHLASLQEFKRSLASRKEVQEASYSADPFVTTNFAPSSASGLSPKRTNITAHEKTDRIRDGRERRWERKRFDPEKYQQLCAEALSEL